MGQCLFSDSTYSPYHNINIGSYECKPVTDTGLHPTNADSLMCYMLHWTHGIQGKRDFSQSADIPLHKCLIS